MLVDSPCGGAGDFSSDCAAGGAGGIGIDGGGVTGDGALRPRDNLANWNSRATRSPSSRSTSR